MYCAIHFLLCVDYFLIKK